MAIKKKTNYLRKAKNTVTKVAQFAYKHKGAITTAGSVAYQAYKVAQIASMINAEKKIFEFTSSLGSPSAVGQCNINANAHFVLDITPTPVSGSYYNARNGASIKMTTSYFRFQMYGMASQKSPVKVIIEIVQIKGKPETTGTVITDLYSLDAFSQLIDSNSNYNPDYYGNFKILRSIKKTINPLVITGETPLTEVQFGQKWNGSKGHHIRYSQDSTTVTDGQIILVIRADVGNISSSLAYSGGNSVPIQGTNTGLNFNYNIRHYYYDN